MKQTTRPLSAHRAPGTTGVEFCELKNAKRDIIVSTAAKNEVYITVGCYRLPLTADEAIAIGEEVARAGRAAK